MSGEVKVGRCNTVWLFGFAWVSKSVGQHSLCLKNYSVVSEMLVIMTYAIILCFGEK